MKLEIPRGSFSAPSSSSSVRLDSKSKTRLWSHTKVGENTFFFGRTVGRIKTQRIQCLTNSTQRGRKHQRRVLSVLRRAKSLIPRDAVSFHGKRKQNAFARRSRKQTKLTHARRLASEWGSVFHQSHQPPARPITWQHMRERSHHFPGVRSIGTAVYFIDWQVDKTETREWKHEIWKIVYSTFILHKYYYLILFSLCFKRQVLSFKH